MEALLNQINGFWLLQEIKEN